MATSEKKSLESLSTRQAARAARDLLARHHSFHGRVDDFEFVQQGEVLTVTGVVPTFYLKQLLQCILKNVDGVRRIDNQVKVVRSATPSDGARHTKHHSH